MPTKIAKLIDRDSPSRNPTTGERKARKAKSPSKHKARKAVRTSERKARKAVSPSSRKARKPR